MGAIRPAVATGSSTRHAADAVASTGTGTVPHVPAPPTLVHLGRVRSIAARAALLSTEIVVVPGVLLYLLVSAGHAMLGLVLVCAWRTSWIGARLALRIAVPTTAWVAFALFSARTIGGLAASSVALYLVVPVATSALQGAVFLGSAFTARPLMGRLMGDFASSVPATSMLRRLFGQLSGWWGLMHLVCAGIGAWAVTLPTTEAVAISSVLGVVCTGGSVAGCAVWGLWRAARLPGLRLVFADRPAQASGCGGVSGSVSGPAAASQPEPAAALA